MKRLYKAVSSHYQNDAVHYTAPLWGDSCNQAVLRRMPKGTPPLFCSSTINIWHHHDYTNRTHNELRAHILSHHLGHALSVS